MNKPLKIKKLLKKSGSLSPLLARARALATLDTQLRELLPPTLRPHCHVLSLHDQALVLAVDSPVWAARLRFHAPKLLIQLARTHTATVRAIRIRVRPPDKSISSGVKRVREQAHDPRRANALQQAAKTVSDPRLKSALLKLSRR